MRIRILLFFFSDQSHKKVGSKVFLTNFCFMIDLNPEPDREAQKHMDPMDPDSDPDPQHWYKQMDKFEKKEKRNVV
jgi:hypothetical protein